ncbi:MAG TPA: DUF6122 family protein [Christiangramia sp.]|nr:DUF6122 family protein [Christiangramia sp.]
MQQIVHYSLHFLVIGIIAYLYDKENWLKYWAILAATMLVDLDHLVAVPIFDPERCGIGFHPLHTEIAITIYILGMIFVKHRIIRLIFIGLFFHMFTDFIDCIWTYSKCATCLQDVF